MILGMTGLPDGVMSMRVTPLASSVNILPITANKHREVESNNNFTHAIHIQTGFNREDRAFSVQKNFIIF